MINKQDVFNVMSYEINHTTSSTYDMALAVAKEARIATLKEVAEWCEKKGECHSPDRWPDIIRALGDKEIPEDPRHRPGSLEPYYNDQQGDDG